VAFQESIYIRNITVILTVGYKAKKPSLLIFFFWCKLSTYLEEFACVLIDVIDANAASEDANVKADAEVGGEHGEAGAVLLEDHLALEEDALGGAAVHLARLADHDRVILQVVQDDQLADAVVLETTLHN